MKTNVSAHIAIVELNRPDHLNALNAELVNELKTALENYSSDQIVKVLVLTGSRKAFAGKYIMINRWSCLYSWS